MLIVNVAETDRSPRGFQPLAVAVQDAENSTMLNRYVGTRPDRYQRMTKDTKHLQHMPR